MAVSARSARLELEEEEGDGDEKHPGSRADKGDAARRARIAGARDAWSCRRSVAVWASSIVTNRESTVILLTDFLLNFDHSKLKFSYRNMKFGQNKSCRGRKDLQLLFWAKVDLRLGSWRKTRTNTAKTMFTIRLD